MLLCIPPTKKYPDFNPPPAVVSVYWPYFSQGFWGLKGPCLLRACSVPHFYEGLGPTLSSELTSKCSVLIHAEVNGHLWLVLCQCCAVHLPSLVHTNTLGSMCGISATWQWTFGEANARIITERQSHSNTTTATSPFNPERHRPMHACPHSPMSIVSSSPSFPSPQFFVFFLSSDVSSPQSLVMFIRADSYNHTEYGHMHLFCAYFWLYT